MVNPKKKQKKKGYVNSGVLYVAQCNVSTSKTICLSKLLVHVINFYLRFLLSG